MMNLKCKLSTEPNNKTPAEDVTHFFYFFVWGVRGGAIGWKPIQGVPKGHTEVVLGSTETEAVDSHPCVNQSPSLFSKPEK